MPRAALLALALPLLSAAAPPDALRDPAPIVSWIGALQTDAPGHPADGALAMRPDPAFYLDGVGYRHVVPYFAHLAVTALLDAAPSPDALALAERHVAWTIAATGPRGVPPEAWVAPDGTQVTCPRDLPTAPAVDRCEHVDATDSAAATLLDLARAYADAGGDPAVLASWAPDLRAAGRVLRALQDRDDGLTIAKVDYPVKYLMDNAETVRGFAALAALERRWGDAAAADRAQRWADKATAGLASMRDRDADLYAWNRQATDADADLAVWYADAVAQAWPILFAAAPTRHAIPAFRHFDAAWDGTLRPDWTTGAVDPGGFAWPALGVAAALAGETARARQQVDALWASVVAPASGPAFPAPFHVADAGWLLRAEALTRNTSLRGTVAAR